MHNSHVNKKARIHNQKCKNFCRIQHTSVFWYSQYSKRSKDYLWPLTTSNLESVNIQFQKQILSYYQKLQYKHEFQVLCLVVNQIYFIITGVDIADLDFLTWISVSRITFFIFLFYLYKIVPNQLTFQISAQINSGQVSMLFKNDSLHYFFQINNIRQLIRQHVQQQKNIPYETQSNSLDIIYFTIVRPDEPHNPPNPTTLHFFAAG
eukprot:TRINITY_DN3623_c0_g1_i8.p1 TRINITY_DN3623_c0_g1~~TRINITY_DN3623_c0_g1_i8.p1  ORF type:complete len:207 (+),score=-11.13 TRINITY_DN3623_c0_g1_i8:520-1140(+)